MGVENRAETLEMAARQQAHQTAIAANFHENVQPLLQNRVEEIQLRHYQPPVLQELDEFMLETKDDLGRAILIPQAGNFGKSFMSIVSMDLAGVGQPVAETGETIRGLFFTSRTVGVTQALQTYNKINPDLKVNILSKRIRPEAYGDTDVFVLTYMAASLMPAEKWQRLIRGRDVFALDEAHRAIGPTTAARLLMAQEVQHPTMLASTATPKFNDDHTVTGVLKINRSTSSTSPRDAIHTGAANEAQLIALYSGQEVTFTARSSVMMSEKDVEPLAHNKERNQLILDTMADMAENGRPGIVQLIPGRDSKHAQNVARWAERKNTREEEHEPIGRLITDPVTGELREMRVRAVGTFQTKTANEHCIKLLNKGKLDALTFTKYITEVFDSPGGLGYVLNGCPTGSWADINQLSARGARFFRLPTLYISLVDRYRSSNVQKRIYTFFDVFEAPRIFQGKRLRRFSPSSSSADTPENTRPLSARPIAQSEQMRHPAGQKTKPLLDLNLSSPVATALEAISSGTILDELLLVKPVLYEIPEGYIPMSELPAVRKGLVTPEGVAYMLANHASKLGKPLSVLAKRGPQDPHRSIRYVLAEEAEAIVNARVVDPSKRVRLLEINAFLESLGWPRMNYQTFLNLCDEAGADYTCVKKGVHTSFAGARKALLRLLETPMINPEEEVALAGMTKVLKLKTGSQLTVIVRNNRWAYLDFLRNRRFGTAQQPYRQVETLTLEGMARLLTIAHRKSRLAQGRGLGARVGTLHKVIDAIGIDNAIRQAQQESRDHYREAGINPMALTREEIEKFLASYSPAVSLQLAEPQFLSVHADEPSAPKNPAAEDTPPQPLDPTYTLSGLGADWVAHAQCIDEDEELFLNPTEERTLRAQKQVNAAKAICAKCVVKGDCLLFALDKADGNTGIFGGFTDQERRGFSDKARRWLRGQE